MTKHPTSFFRENTTDVFSEAPPSFSGFSLIGQKDGRRDWNKELKCFYTNAQTFWKQGTDENKEDDEDEADDEEDGDDEKMKKMMKSASSHHLPPCVSELLLVKHGRVQRHPPPGPVLAGEHHHGRLHSGNWLLHHMGRGHGEPVGVGVPGLQTDGCYNNHHLNHHTEADTTTRTLLY